ncbi:DNA repair-scaffolding protein isoform X2 [Choloepus didactylus]|uniref:DNA repair-scaffolding protein isoform X2 n=1 Tax=Choloepus didactylus TaxID=27675 RepID=UPI00189F7BDC|nr:DNA repair-scaffolding protein isoform X2 [Choloepus didactylus]
MPRSGRARGPKRKRNWDIDYPSFPGESPLQCREAGLKTVDAAATLSEAWLRCGEGFQNTSETPVLSAKMKTITDKCLELSPRPKEETSPSKSENVSADLTWNSSGSDLSDEDKILYKSQNDNGHSYKIDRFCNKNALCPEDGASEDELQFIDWEIDSDREGADECNEFEEGESAVEISDCASCASSCLLTSEEKLSELPKTSSTEILEYSSESEKEDSENILFIDSESPHKYEVDFGSNSGQVMEKVFGPRMNSTETVLCTPQKQTSKFSRTPEDSAKKKKLIRGGLAERLNGLQNRERSAISFWRHRCVSYQKSGGNSSVLIVRILEIHEEYAMQVALCEQLGRQQATSPDRGVAPSPSPRAYLKVLFTRETAGLLRGRPQDTVHIYPPWQKLVIPDGSCPVILNTYFCRKVGAKEDSESTREERCQDTPLPRRIITLHQMFRCQGLADISPESQVLCGSEAPQGAGRTPARFSAHTLQRDSLLDVVDSQGASPRSGVRVRVVVQRTYALPSRDGAQGRQGGSPTALQAHADPPGARICLLVQDAYGLFGEVHVEGTVLKDRQLEGKPCSLAGMKILQKATRGRTVGLFSLIDTMWPPVMPLKALGHSQSWEEVKTNLPPPSFCYILTAHPNLGQIDVMEEDPISKLYQPAVPRCLREILQADDVGTRCSFYAQVIYQQPQPRSFPALEQRDIWLMVTDLTLQMEDGSDSGLPRTVPVRVAPSCGLSPDVLGALTTAPLPSIFFRDALRQQGWIVCVERSVLLLQKPPLCVASGACPSELTGPVKLDELDAVTQTNSICTVQGTVVGVDESTAFSWPVCDRCGNGRLEQSPEDSGGAFHCGQCSQEVTSPILRRHLEIFLDCPSRPQCTVKVKLLQPSIASLLSHAAGDDGSYEVKSVLGKEVGLLNCFVRTITNHPASCVGLEEIELLSVGRASEGHQRLLEYQ